MKTIRFYVLGFGLWLMLLLAINPVSAQDWAQSTYNYLQWTAVASSANGKLVWATLTNGPAFYSTNSGMSWDVRSWNNSYYTTGMASSPNGDVLVAVTGYLTPGKIYVSTNSGVTWPETTAPLRYWTSVACSADGRKIVASEASGSVYISTDTGQTWTPGGVPVKYWVSVTISADGTQLAAASTNGVMCVSTDGGNTWMTNSSGGSASMLLPAKWPAGQANNSAPNTNWQAVACSADKSQLVAVVNGGPIFLSTDAGTNWTASSAPNAGWKAIACSADGGTIIAAVTNGPIYTSTNAGATWVSNSIPLSSWVSVAASADGSRLVAAAKPGSGQPKSIIYTLYNVPKPRLHLVKSGGQAGLAWTLTGTNFVVQQSMGLNGAGWQTLTNEPTLNLSNLQYQLSLPMTNSSGYFRLATP